MKIVVTGALGHIGSEVVRKLAPRGGGWEIVMIDNMMTQRYCSLFNLPEGTKYRFLEADLLKMDLKPVLEKADAVIHLAAMTDAAGSFENKEKLEHNNFNATARVAEACAAAGCKLVHLSSTSVYGTQKDVVDEDCTEEELAPQSPYADTKLKEERHLQTGLGGKLRFITFRFGTICGTSPGMRFHTAVNKFCWQAVMGQPITVWKTALNQKRPYLDLSDGVAAMRFVLEKDLFDNRIYNVLTENMTVRSILDSISTRIPEYDVEYVETKIMNQLSYNVSDKRFTGLGFRVEGSIDRRIGDTIALLRGAASARL
ncbi:MAG: SDR family oxidoreductase [Elusimicrobia bacterium]|nr:SDR family oxidoreductase [Elusimicrobiota bacterium]